MHVQRQNRNFSKRPFRHNVFFFPPQTTMTTIILLTISNIFMTFAWYGHLKFKNTPLWIVILVSWMIAFMEYCFQVPANRIGHNQFSSAQLKTIQEVINCFFHIFNSLSS